MLSGNKGEWAEIYIFLKVIHDGKIYAADKNMNKLENVFLNVVRVLREEIPQEEFNYFTSITDDGFIRITKNGIEIAKRNRSEFHSHMVSLWELISRTTKGAIQSEELSAFLDSIYIHKLKATAVKTSEYFGGTQDITMEIMDYRSGVNSIVGFSCKADFENCRATLFNASADNTNFKYEVYGINDGLMEEFNNIYDEKNSKTGTKKEVAIAKRMKFLKENGCNISFHSACGKYANRNLILSGGVEMPAIIGEMLKYDFFIRSSDVSSRSIKNAIMYIIATDPARYSDLGLQGIDDIYKRRVSTLLYDMFTGMRLGSLWDGQSSVNGGYIVAKSDGDIVACHSCMTDMFKDFLLSTLEFESPSCSRHKYMTIFKEEEKYYLKLNLQVRFANKWV